MLQRIEVYPRVSDSRANVRKQKLLSFGFSSVESIFLADVYTLVKKILPKDRRRIIPMFVNPVIQVVKPLCDIPFSYAIEIGYLPGVTDNIATTAKEMIEDLLGLQFDEHDGVYSSQITFISGNLSVQDVERIGLILANPLIQRIHIKSFQQYQKDKGMDHIVPKVKMLAQPSVTKVNLDVSDEELIRIGKEGIANPDGTRRGPLALDLSYIKTIQNYFKQERRQPTDVELESIAQTWSEHCKHTIFADPIDEISDGLYKSFIKGATKKIREAKGKDDFCVSVFSDNSGAIEFDTNYLITDKVETHNSPSALDPFGGAITGIVGVNRDALGFGLGAKPVANRYGFCFSDPRTQTNLYRDKEKTQKMLSPRRIMDGVIEGVNAGGNCSGIPTPDGFVYFDDRYQGKPLVFVGTIGLIPRKIKGNPSYEKKANPGDYIVMIGGRVGIDGIHGATFSSESLSSGSPVSAVQIGDPITQKKFSDAIAKEARDLGLYSSITDNGAGGLSCSVAEMAKESGGFVVDLDNVPLKYPGLEPWQIWISESQERMTLSVPVKKWRKFESLMRRRGVEATVIGKFTDSGQCIVDYKGERVMSVSMDFLHNGLPPRRMRTVYKKTFYKDTEIPQPKDVTALLHDMISRPNIAGTSFISSQFDHTVQSESVLMPLQGKGRVNAETTAIRPILSSEKGVMLSHALYPTYSEIDPYQMAACSIDSAIRNLVAAGADPKKIAILDNFCWCSADDPQRLGELKLAAQACYDYAVSFGTPFIAGKDSMFNDFNGFDETGSQIKISVPPTLLISSLSVVENIQKIVSLDIKHQGDLLYLMGETYDELAGSEYGTRAGTIPKVDAKRNLALYLAYYTCIQNGIIASAISVGRGGLGIGLAKMCLGGLLGIQVALRAIPGKVTRDDYTLFSESQGRILVTIDPKNQKKFENTMKGQAYSLIGTVRNDEKYIVEGREGKEIIRTTIKDLLTSYRSTFEGY